MLSKSIKKLKKILVIPTLRKRVMYTFLMFLVVRGGILIPLPGVNLEGLKAISKSGFLDFVNLVSGGAFSRASIFTLSIFPYINASIIIYILTLSFKKLDEMQKEGGKGKQKINQWTRYLAVLMSIIHSIGVAYFLRMNNLTDGEGASFFISTVLVLTASVTFLTWVGDRISVNGVGNGISLIIFLGIIARLPSSIISVFNISSNMNIFFLNIAIIGALAFGLIFVIVIFQTAVRKIKVVYASGKGSTIVTPSYLPIRINNAGVMPIIFAGIVSSLPTTLANLLPETWAARQFILTWFAVKTWTYLFMYFIAVLFFTFFYTAVVFDAEKIAENLRKGGALIPGKRPGKESEAYLESIILKITFGSALFLATLAVLPHLLSMFFGASFSVGGTGIIIAVSVAVETLQQIEGALSMEEYSNII